MGRRILCLLFCLFDLRCCSYRCPLCLALVERIQQCAFVLLGFGFSTLLFACFYLPVSFQPGYFAALLWFCAVLWFSLFPRATKHSATIQFNSPCDTVPFVLDVTLSQGAAAAAAPGAEEKKAAVVPQVLKIHLHRPKLVYQYLLVLEVYLQGFVLPMLLVCEQLIQFASKNTVRFPLCSFFFLFWPDRA